MRALLVHAHYDDYEFTAAGTFERCRRSAGSEFEGRVLICTDGAAGHQWRTRRETARLRRAEQEASARLGGYGFELLRLPNGRVPREGGLTADRPFQAALWRSIRAFEPDYLFCPPLPADPRYGVHGDHLAVAEAIRRVAYLINVPHAFTPEYPADERHSANCRTPVILNTFDTYSLGTESGDLVVDIGDVFEQVAALSWCHQTQIREWLPWVGRHQMDPPSSLEEWSKALRARFLRRQRCAGVRRQSPVEIFGVTAWGEVPSVAQLQRDFPGVCAGPRLRRLGRRLAVWKANSFA